jgi:hypothetical protein
VVVCWQVGSATVAPGVTVVIADGTSLPQAVLTARVAVESAVDRAAVDRPDFVV